MRIPHYINRKNKKANYYYDSLNNKYIHISNIKAYVEGLDKEVVAVRDEAIRAKRYDLNY